MAINKATTDQVKDLYEESLFEWEEAKESEQALQEAKQEQEKEQNESTEQELREEAEKILAEASYKLLRGKQITAEKRAEVGEKGLILSEEYKTKKQAIESDGDLKDVAKGRKLNELYAEYSRKMRELVKEQGKLNDDYFKERKEMAERLLKEANSKANLSHFSDKEMSYILFVAENGNKQSILALLKEFDFNPFLIRLLNIKDEKKPKNERLNLVHPLELILRYGRERNGNDLLVTLQSGVELPRSVDDLIPLKNVPNRDSWSKYQEPKKKWFEQ